MSSPTCSEGGDRTRGLPVRAAADGPPVIGRARYASLRPNTGHGALGRTMSCGSGRVLADSALRPEARESTRDRGRGCDDRASYLGVPCLTATADWLKP